MRLLFVHEVNYLRKVVYEIHDVPERLSLNGHFVAFIDFPEGETRLGLRRFLDLRTRRRSKVARAHAGASVEVITPGRVLPPPFDRVLATVTHVPAIYRELRSNAYDAVVLYAVPTNGWQTVMLARRLGVPVLFRAIDISHELRSTPYRSLIRRAERYIYSHADGISVNNVALRDYVIAAGASPDGVTLDYPGLDMVRFSPGQRDPALGVRYVLGVDDRVILFMGTLFRFSGLDWLLTELAPALRTNPHLKFLILGGGEAEADLRNQVEELGISDAVVFTGVIGYDDLADHLRLADVAVNPFLEQLVTNCALPGKVLQYAGCGLPTVCTRLAGMRGMIPAGEGVFYRAPGAEFAQKVLDLIEDEPARADAAQKARISVEALCDWEASTARFESALEAVVRRDR